MTQHVNALIRKHFNIANDAPISLAVRAIYKLTTNLGDRTEKLQQLMIKPEFFRDYGVKFGEGIQWIQAKYPHCRGANGVYIGMRGQKIKDDVGGTIAPIPGCTIKKSTGDANILIPFEDIYKRQGQKIFNQTCNFIDESRSELKDLTWDESVFLAGVEETYHAIQCQDQNIKDRLTQEENALRQRLGEDAKTYLDSKKMVALSGGPAASDYHEIAPRELDVVPILKQALAEYRQKKLEVRGVS